MNINDYIELFPDVIYVEKRLNWKISPMTMVKQVGTPALWEDDG